MEVNSSLSIDAAERNDCNGAKKRSKENLPHDLVIEILSWLHIKHLSPLRCVSKSWLHLLTKTPQFSKLHFDRFMQINNNHPNPMIIGSPRRDEGENDSNLFIATEVTSCEKAFHVEFPFYQPTNRYDICGISNGLVCIWLCEDFIDNDKEVHIWNPLINDHITILCPNPSIRFPGYQRCTAFGFGFVQDVNVYKVVRLFVETCFDSGDVKKSWTQISVYTIGVDSVWRTVEVDIPYNLTLTNAFFPLVNGALHWHKSRRGTDSWDRIVTFDLKEEVIGDFRLPEGIQFEDIVELSGLLCAVDRREDEQETHIWVMKEYGVVSSWSKQYIIGKPEGCIHKYDFSVLGLTHNGGIILMSSSDNLVLYSPETNTVKDLKGFQFDIYTAYAFLGSIISPTAIIQAGHTLLEEGS